MFIVNFIVIFHKMQSASYEIIDVMINSNWYLAGIFT